MKYPIIALAAMLAAGAVRAESAVTVRSTELQAQAQSDQAVIAVLPENTRVDVLSRRGAWSEVSTAAGQKGWVRMLSLKPDSIAPVNPTAQRGSGSVGALTNLLGSGRTASNATVTTGVRGLDEEDLRNASPNFSELQKAKGFSADASAAQNFGQRSQLTPVRIEYLQPVPASMPSRGNESNFTGG